MNKVLWIYNRLKAMSSREVLHRVKRAVSKKVYKKKYEKAIKVNEIYKGSINLEKLYENLKMIFEEPDFNRLKSVDKFYTTFNIKVDLEKEINWNKGMYSYFDKDKSSFDMEFKNTDDVGDIRFSWEINRHQFMPYLAASYIKSNDKEYLKLLEKHFESFIEENVFLKGINWSSAMEIALRSYQWLVVIYILKGEKEAEKLKVKMAESIIVSIDYVMKNLSLYSSANNHLIVETAISSIVGLAFKDVYDQDWFESGYDILAKEIELQFHKDGVNKEQALHYQAFVTDMMLQYNSIMKKSGYKAVEEELIKRSVEFMYLLKADRIYMDFGDSDDAKIVNFSPEYYNYYDYILSLASEYYKINYKNNEDKYIEVSLFQKVNKKDNDYRISNVNLYKEGGYLLINNDRSNILFDFAELGFGSLAAHGHADCLSFMYAYKENEFFIDSGTYVYNIKKEKRDFYRSTGMHNTLCFDNGNQSEIKGPFLWGRKAEAELTYFKESKGNVTIAGKHNGYAPFIHKRKLEYKAEGNILIIKDYFEKEAELNFILAPEVKVKKIDEKVYELENEEKLYLYLEGSVGIEETTVSKKFLEEKTTRKIAVKYDFSKEHVSIICDDLEKLKTMI